jgi:hypothetical protein
MNLETESKSILEKFIIHLYDDFNFEEAKLKIASELTDNCYEEKLYGKYWFGNQYVRTKILINYSDKHNRNRHSNDILILEKICKEEFGQHYLSAFTLAFNKVPFYYRKHHPGRNAQLLTAKFIQDFTIEQSIMTYLSYYYYENQEHFEIIIDSLNNPNILK